MSCPPPDPTDVSIGDLHMMVMRDTSDPHLVHFGAALPDPALLPEARLTRILMSLARRGEVGGGNFVTSEGVEELRVQVSQRLYGQGCRVTPEEVTITSGCSESLNLALQAVTHPGDLVAVESPTYFGLLATLECLGLRALEIPTHPSTGMDLQALRFAVQNHPVSTCVSVSNFSNPLGSRMTDEAKRELVEILAEREIPLIEDDITGELYFEGDRPSVAKRYDSEGRVLLCSSFSKDIAPAYRVGWIAPGRYARQVRRLRAASACGAPVLSQRVIAEFLARGGYEHHLRRMRRAYGQRVAQMGQAVVRLFPSGTKVTTPSGGFLLWVEMPEEVDALVLYRKALHTGISLVPGHLFSPTTQFRNCIRLNAAYWSERTEPALARLGQLAQQTYSESSRGAASRTSWGSRRRRITPST
jgi:DNA-binding transcriptional MocR family regulator